MRAQLRSWSRRRKQVRATHLMVRGRRDSGVESASGPLVALPSQCSYCVYLQLVNAEARRQGKAASPSHLALPSPSIHLCRSLPRTTQTPVSRPPTVDYHSLRRECGWDWRLALGWRKETCAPSPCTRLYAPHFSLRFIDDPPSVALRSPGPRLLYFRALFSTWTERTLPIVKSCTP